jgi:hypothetical protein
LHSSDSADKEGTSIGPDGKELGPDGQELGVYDDDDEDGNSYDESENNDGHRIEHAGRSAEQQLLTQQTKEANQLQLDDDLNDISILNSTPVESSGVAQLQQRLLDRFTLNTETTAEQGTYKLF